MNENVARPAVPCSLLRVPDMRRWLFDLVHQCDVMIPSDLCKRCLHNFISRKTRCKLRHVFEIPDGISFHLREGQLDVCGKVFDKLAAPDLVRVDDRADGVVQPKQLAVYLNCRAILRCADFLLDLFDRFQVFVCVHQHSISLLALVYIIPDTVTFVEICLS